MTKQNMKFLEWINYIKHHKRRLYCWTNKYCCVMFSAYMLYYTGGASLYFTSDNDSPLGNVTLPFSILPVLGRLFSPFTSEVALIYWCELYQKNICIILIIALVRLDSVCMTVHIGETKSKRFLQYTLALVII